MFWKAALGPLGFYHLNKVFGYLSDSARLDESIGRGVRFVTTAIPSASRSKGVKSFDRK